MKFASLFIKFSFLCFLMAVMPLWAQKIAPVVIRGHADFAVGEEIRLIVYEDLLTYTPKVVSSDMVDRSGAFELSYTTAEVRLVQLEIRTSRAEFLVEPSKTYDFTISMDAELFNFFRPQDYDGFLHVKNENESSQDLNRKVNYFSGYYNYAFDKYYFPIVYDGSVVARDSVLSMMQQKFEIRYNPYDFYQSYVFYGISHLDRIYW